MTRRERLERKLEKREEWADNADKRASERFDRASEVASHIPMGQPILVGHHSEKHHRADLKRIDQNMGKGCEETAKAKHHRAKADGLERQLRTTIFSDDEDAIEELEAKIARLEREREVYKRANRIIRRKPKNQKTMLKIEELVGMPGINEAASHKLFEPDFCGRIGFPPYLSQNLGGRIKAARDRIVQIKRRQEKQAKAEEAGGVDVTGYGEYAIVTFAEKPERKVIVALKAAGFSWGGGSWTGKRADLPEEIG